MINTERIAKLTEWVEAVDQVLLDVDPETDLFWQVTDLRDRTLEEIDHLRTEGV